MPVPAEWILAIDFGTSFTVAAVRARDRAADVVEIDGERRVPSVVFSDERGAILVGRTAEDRARFEPGRALRRPKARLGETAPVVLGGRGYRIADLVGALLAHVASEAQRHMGSAPTEIRLTHPASWSRTRRNTLLDAAAQAGLPRPVLVPEPVAAAVSYADDTGVAPGAYVLVYDLGGGTFDSAILRATDGGFTVVGRPVGDVTFGGELFDELLANLIGERLQPAAFEALTVSEAPEWRQAASALRGEARRAKEALSAYDFADVLVGLPTGNVQQRVTRDEFENLIRTHIEDSVELIDRLLDDAEISADDLTAIYLAGGASRTPVVSAVLKGRFPHTLVSRRGDPKLAVSLGATHEHATTRNPKPATSIDEPTDPTPTDLPPRAPPREPPTERDGTRTPKPATSIDEPKGPTPTDLPPPAPPREPRTERAYTSLPSPFPTDSRRPNRIPWIGAAVLAAVGITVAVVVMLAQGDTPNDRELTSGTTRAEGTTAAPETQAAPDTIEPPDTTAAPDTIEADAAESIIPTNVSCSTPVSLAFLGARTGSGSSLGVGMMNGAQLAIQHFNEANSDCPITLISLDSQGSPDRASALAADAISDEAILGVVGPGFAGESAATGAIFNDAGLATITPSATAPDLATNGWATWNRLLGNDAVLGRAVAKYISETLGSTSVFVVDDASEYGKGLADIVRSSLRGSATGGSQVQQGDTDFSSVVTAANDSGADTLVYGGYYPEAGLLVKQLREGGFEGHFIAGDGVFHAGFVDTAGVHAEGAIVTCTCSPPNEAGVEFGEAYEDAFQESPSTYSAEAYDAASVFLRGVADGVTDRSAMVEYVRTFEGPALTKTISFTEHGELQSPPVWALRAEAGGFVSAGRIDP